MLVCISLCNLARETAGAARTRSSLRPLFFSGRKLPCRTRAHRVARWRTHIGADGKYMKETADEEQPADDHRKRQRRSGIFSLVGTHSPAPCPCAVNPRA